MSPNLQAMIVGTILGLLIGLALRKLADKVTIEHLRWQLKRAGEQLACEQRRLAAAERDYAELLAIPPYGRALALSHLRLPIARDVEAVSRN